MSDGLQVSLSTYKFLFKCITVFLWLLQLVRHATQAQTLVRSQSDHFFYLLVACRHDHVLPLYLLTWRVVLLLLVIAKIWVKSMCLEAWSWCRLQAPQVCCLLDCYIQTCDLVAGFESDIKLSKTPKNGKRQGTKRKSAVLEEHTCSNQAVVVTAPGSLVAMLDWKGNALLLCR